MFKIYSLLLAAAVVVFQSGNVVGQTEKFRPEVRAKLAPTGPLRVAFPLNRLTTRKNPANGELGGLAADFGRELAAYVDAAYEPIEFQSPGKFIEVAASGAWDMTLLVIDPSRAGVLAYTSPVIEVDFTYLVPAGSKISSIAETDRPGVRIATVRGDASDVYLTRTLKSAELVRMDVAGVTEVLKSGSVDAATGNRVVLPDFSKQIPGSRILEGNFGVLQLALAVPKSRPDALVIAERFVQHARTSGLVKQIIERSGTNGLKIALIAPKD